MKRFAILLILPFLLSCTYKDSTETIIDEHLAHFNESLAYAQNNFEQIPEIVYLENELKSCTLTLSAARESHRSNLETWKTKTDYWRLASTGLGLLVGVLLFFMFKKKIWL